MRTDLIHPDELGDGEIKAWKAITAEMGTYSAFMEPEFARAAGAARGDARVAIFEDDGEVIGFWPFHKRPMHFARPIGAPFSDQHGPAIRSGADFDTGAAIKAMGMCVYAYSTLLDPEARFSSGARAVQDGYVAETGGDGQAYAARLKAEHKRYHKTIERRRRKLENERGEVKITLRDQDPEAFETILGWKRNQYAATGLHDVLAPQWVRAMLDALDEAPGEDFGLRMSTLRVEGRLAAGEICLLGAGALHSWIPAYDAEFSTYSPGLQLLRALIAGTGELGVDRVDLGAGHGYYKRYFTFERQALVDGAAFADGAGARVLQSAMGGWRRLEAAPLGPMSTLAGKTRRRLGQIAAVEPGLGGRVRGVARAFRQHAPG